MLAAEVGGQRRFEVEADTVGSALRSLPVANLVFDERGQLRQLVNVYVDGVDVREHERHGHAAHRQRGDPPRRRNRRGLKNVEERDGVEREDASRRPR